MQLLEASAEGLVFLSCKTINHLLKELSRCTQLSVFVKANLQWQRALFFFFPFSFSFFFSKADSWVFRMYLGVFSEHCRGVSLCGSQEAQWHSWTWNLTYAFWKLLRNYFFFQDSFSANKGILHLRLRHGQNVWSVSKFSLHFTCGRNLTPCVVIKLNSFFVR